MEEDLRALFIDSSRSPKENSRVLLDGFGKSFISNAPVPKWKESLWDNNSVEPAMLRVPIVILAFIVLWGANVLLFDRFKLRYQNVMSIKSGF